MARYEWPPTEGLVAFVRRHGTLTEAARKLGVAPSTLSTHLNRCGVDPDEYCPRKQLDEKALEEIRELIS